MWNTTNHNTTKQTVSSMDHQLSTTTNADDGSKRPGAHRCTLCARCFVTGTRLRRHVRAVHEARPALLACGDCDQRFGRRDSVRRHKKSGACKRRADRRQAVRARWKNNNRVTRSSREEEEERREVPCALS